MNATAIPSDQTILRTVSREMPDRSFILANVGLHMIDGNRSAYWTATAEIYEAHGARSGRARFNNDRDSDMGGQLHPEIVRAFPFLAPIVAVHLSDSDGFPMYALENGAYHLRNGNLSAASSLWRCTLEDLEPMIIRDGAGHVTGCTGVVEYVESQRDRWSREAAAAYAVLTAI